MTFIHVATELRTYGARRRLYDTQAVQAGSRSTKLAFIPKVVRGVSFAPALLALHMILSTGPQYNATCSILVSQHIIAGPPLRIATTNKSIISSAERMNSGGDADMVAVQSSFQLAVSGLDTIDIRIVRNESQPGRACS